MLEAESSQLGKGGRVCMCPSIHPQSQWQAACGYLSHRAALVPRAAWERIPSPKPLGQE